MRIGRSSHLAWLVLTVACGNPDSVPSSDASSSGGDGSSGFSASLTNGTNPSSTTMPMGETSATTDPTVGSADTTTTGRTFLDVDMGGGNETCDVFAQDCPRGEKCMPWANDGGQSWNSTTCVPVSDNPGQPGDPCTVEGNAVSGIDDCDLGSMCYSVSVETNMGTCFELCGGSPGAPVCNEGLCAVYNDGNLPLCLPDCDPLLQDCPGEQLCLASPSANGFVCILDSLPFSLGDHGAPCEYVNTCDPGLFCAVSEVVAGCMNASGCCAEFCDLSLPDPSGACTGQAGGEECLPWYGVEVPPPGYEDVGFCGIP